MKNTIWILFLAVSVPTPTLASENSQLRFHGFLSQGLIATNENLFFGDSDTTSFEFTDAGFGATWRATGQLQTSIQGVYRQAGDLAETGFLLDYAMINYSIVNRLEYGVQLRAGRVKNPVGFFNETRDIAATRPSILLPQSTYREELRTLFHSSDSISINAYTMIADHLITVDAVAGKINTDDTVEEFLSPSGDLDSSLDNDFQSQFRIMLEPSSGNMRFGLSLVDGETDVISVFPLPFGLPGTTTIETLVNVQFMLGSFEYTWNRWQFTTEYGQIELDISNSLINEKITTESYYFQLVYAINPEWSILTRYDVLYNDKNDKSGDNLAAEGRPSFDAFAKDFTLGVRFQPTSHFLLAAELHVIEGTAWLTDLENLDPTQRKKYWDLFTLQASYKF